MPPCPYRDLDRFRTFIESRPFKFAATMPENPHEYTVRIGGLDTDFVNAAAVIAEHGYDEQWLDRRTYRYLNLNGHRYWTMEDRGAVAILNRKPLAYPSLYDEIAGHYDDIFADEASIQEDREVLDKIEFQPGERILDIGAGTGLLLDRIDIEPTDYVGIEPSAGMRERFIAKHPDHADRLIPAPFEDFAGGRFDVIVALYGTASHLPPSHYGRLDDLLSSVGRRFLMFYEDGYQPRSCVGASRPSDHIEGGWRQLTSPTPERYHHYLILR